MARRPHEMRRRQIQMHLAACHPTTALAHAKHRETTRAGPHYVSVKAGFPWQLNGRLAPASECIKRQASGGGGGGGGDGGLKNRLRRPAALATQQKKSQTTTTATSTSPSPSPCCGRLIDRTKTSRPISILKKTNIFKSSHQQQKSRSAMPTFEVPLGQVAAQMLVPPSGSPSSFSQHQQASHQSPVSSTNTSDQQPAQSTVDQMEMIKKVSRDFAWTWDESCCSPSTRECQINPDGDKLEVCFHPLGSESTAACRGSKPLVRNGNYYYWELTVSEKCYGTSVMFGLCTLRQNLHALDYCNIIGLDECGWSLSHKGLIWHQGNNRQFTLAFPTNQPITIGLLFNTMRGELSYFMDGKNLGIAFCGLNDIKDDLYPAVGSTAKNTKIRITGSYCGYVSLLERSCFSILKNYSHNNREQLLDYLKRCQLPRSLMEYLSQVAEFRATPITIKTANHQEENNISNTMIPMT